MLPSLTTYSAAELRRMADPDKLRFARELAAYKPYVDQLGMTGELKDAYELSHWLHMIERPLRGLPLPLYLDYQELALRADRALGQVMANLRASNMLTRRGTQGDSGLPVMADYGVDESRISRFVRFFAGLDCETFESAIARGRTERNLSGANVRRIVRGEESNAHTQRVIELARLAAEGKTSHEIARQLGYRDAANARITARRNEIDIPGDRTHAAQLKNAVVTRSAQGFSHRNYAGLSNALAALDHVMSDAEGQLHPDVTADQAHAWAKELGRGRAQLTRLINTLKEAATP